MLFGEKPKNPRQARKQAKEQQKAEKILKRSAIAIVDPGSQYERELQKLGLGKRDSALIGRLVDYSYGALTLGTAPLAKMALDEGRSRVAQAKNNNGSSSSGSSSSGSSLNRQLANNRSSGIQSSGRRLTNAEILAEARRTHTRPDFSQRYR